MLQSDGNRLELKCEDGLVVKVCCEKVRRDDVTA